MHVIPSRQDSKGTSFQGDMTVEKSPSGRVFWKDMAGYLPSSCLDSRYLHATRRLVVKELLFTDGSCRTLVVQDVLYEEYEELDSRRHKTA